MFRLAAVVSLVLSGTAALAESCWLHNGSLMRLRDAGSARAFHYESPRPELWDAGVGRGTRLFRGERVGDWMQGYAAVFSAACPAQPLEYWVEGPISANPPRIEMQGRREVVQGCAPTGRTTVDRLVFTYSHRC